MATLERLVIIGDPHGDKIKEGLADRLFAFLDDFRPKLVIHGGDNWDFRYLRNGASEKEEGEDASLDFSLGSEFMLRYLSYGTQRVFLRGNHDERPYDTYRNATKEKVRIAARKVIEDMEKVTAKRRAQVLPYSSRQGVLDLNGLRVIHGYACGINAARRFAQVYGTCAFLHTHSMDVAPAESWPSPAVAYGAGCLMEPDQPYNDRQVNKLRHENGFLYGYIINNKATLFQARLGGDGCFHAASEIKAY